MKSQSLINNHMRIGIYGGGFNPVHYTHLKLAEIITADLRLDRLNWVPTGVAWHKAGQLAPAEHRVKMLQLAFESVASSNRDKWQISRCEIDHSGDSYTINTIKILQQEQSFLKAKWFLMIGADQFNLLHTWKDWSDLLTRVKLVVFDREGVELQVQSEVLEQADWVHMRVTPSPLSSSYIRALVGQEGFPFDAKRVVERLCEFVPPLVAKYIVKNGLYINEKIARLEIDES